MIFVTVGTQLSFDRLISAVDRWCLSNPAEEVFAQIGPSQLKIRNMKFAEFVAPEKASELFGKARLVVAHAGMGSILSTLKYRKPILVLPRKASLGEHRNEHQLATAKWLSNRPGIFVARDESELVALLDKRDSLVAGEGITDFASSELLERIKAFINQ